MFDARIACPPGFSLDRSFYRSRLKGQQTARKFELGRSEHYFILLSPKGKAFALLDLQTTKALRSLEEVRHARFEAVIHSSLYDIHNMQEATQKLDHVCDISVNVYGPHDLATRVGNILTQVERYLQHPLLLDYGMEYSNPQYFMVPNSSVDFSQFVKNRQHGLSSKRTLSLEVLKLLDSLGVVEIGNELPPNLGVATPLLRSVVQPIPDAKLPNPH